MPYRCCRIWTGRLLCELCSVNLTMHIYVCVPGIWTALEMNVQTSVMRLFDTSQKVRDSSRTAECSIYSRHMRGPWEKDCCTSIRLALHCFAVSFVILKPCLVNYSAFKPWTFSGCLNKRSWSQILARENAFRALLIISSTSMALSRYGTLTSCDFRKNLLVHLSIKSSSSKATHGQV